MKVEFNDFPKSSVGQRSRYIVIEHDYTPLAQRMVLMKSASVEAKQFYQYLQSPKAQAVFTEFGFGLPDSR